MIFKRIIQDECDFIGAKFDFIIIFEDLEDWNAL